MEHWSNTSPLQKVTPPENGSASTGPTDQLENAPPDNDSAHAQTLSITTNEAGQEGVSSSSPDLPNREAFEPLPAFPKEFNKNYLQALDKRYLVILLLTLLLEPLLIWYLIRTHPPGMSEHDISKLQNKYAELFMSEFRDEQEPPESQFGTDLLTQASKIAEQIFGQAGAEGIGEKPAPEANVNLPRFRQHEISPETRALPGEHRQAVRRLNTLTRQRGMQALSEQVERVGLLGVITSGSGVVSSTPIRDILQFADSTASDIDRVLAQVTELRVPRAGIDYFRPVVHYAGGSTRLGNASEVLIAPREVRGKRTTSSGVMPEDIVTGLAAAPQKSVERNRTFEQVASVPALIPDISGLRSQPANSRGTRERDKIRDLVASHNPAIQDCYRQQLKGFTTLKGKVTVRFTINPMGHVVDAQVVKSEMIFDSMPILLPEMQECILNKIRKWRGFGQVDEAVGDVTFRQTYVFGY
ncbi:MAG: AgmX/PglI C-terminal domain-containing protein [candidate division KSB1 bacterium]|nr:AgmX/PglI C-terminal domain-containing protein [candidate division KSB1 bacterium]MDZ7302062.1 AgmX/PglI C-terminal domain-containing protein [candidate division KSB1 bacterium]MDZ7311104.1 AgmX/PglI C-terminal domain-containing protein [candidate division KSB1 bacterium]